VTRNGETLVDEMVQLGDTGGSRVCNTDIH